MAGLADERHGGVALAGDRGDHAERLAEPFEHRPLLDVHLQVSERRRPAAAPARRRQIAEPMPSSSRELEPRRERSRRPSPPSRGRQCRSAPLPRPRSRDPDRDVGYPRSSTAIATSTPSGPSYRPALRTVSRCEPSTNGRPSPRRPIRLPTSSSRTVRPASCIQPADELVGLPHGLRPVAAGEPAALLADPAELGAALEDPAPRRSTAPVGAVGPGRDQQRHVVVGVRVGDREAHRHAVEEARARRSSRRPRRPARTRRRGSRRAGRARPSASVTVVRRAAAGQASSIFTPGAGRPAPCRGRAW